MNKILFILVCITLGVYRIDLAEWNGSFQITPILITSILFVIFYSVYLLNSEKVGVPKNFHSLLVLLSLILTWCLLGIDYYDIIQIKRVILFAFLMLFGILINIYVFNHPNPKVLLYNFVLLTLIIYSILSIFQYYYFMHNIVYVNGNSIYPWLELYSQAVNLSSPRLNGGFLDPNIAGYFLIFLFLILHLIETTSKHLFLKSLIVFLVLITISRSAIGTLLILLILIYLKSIKLDTVLRFSLKKIVCVLGILITVFVTISYFDTSGKLDNIFTSRVTIKDRSAQIHFGLIEYGYEKILEDPETFIKGYGFGSAYLLTSKFFGSNKYGNFHSEFLTIQIETGVIGLVFYLLIIITPILFILRKPKLDKYYYILILFYLAAILENIFYQQYLFHYYWVFLLIPWFFSDSAFKKKLLATNE